MAVDGREISIDIVANDHASRVFSGVGTSMSGMANKINSGINSISHGLNRYNSAMNGLYRSTQVAMVGAGYAVYKFTSSSIQQFAEFEKQHGKTMGAVVNNYAKTAEAQKQFIEDQKKVKEQAIELGTVGPNGKGTFYNPSEVATAQTQLAKAGYKSNEIESVLPSVLKFAGGNDLSIDQATEYSVNLAEMYGVKRDNKSFSKMMDELTRTADISTIDVPDLMESMKYAGTMASAMGRPIEEVEAMVALMGNVGLKGTMSGTGIQALFTRMLSPVGKGKAAMNTAPDQLSQNALKTFMKDATDSKGNFKPMTEISDMLSKAMATMNDKQQTWFAQKLFGMFQMKAGYALGKEGGAKLQSVIDDITKNSDGSNDKKWDIMLNTSYGKQEALKNAMTGFKTDFGYRLSPITNAITDELFEVLNNKGNYNINWSKLQSSLYEAGNIITEQYGSQLGNAIVKMGNLGLSSMRVGVADSPVIGGFLSGVTDLLGGDLPGALKDFSNGINSANENISNLPPDLQGFAKEVKNAMLALMAITATNFTARILESFVNIWKATVGKSSVINANNVYVNGKNVGGGTGTGTGTGGAGVGGTILNKNGEPINGTKTTKPIVDQYGNPIKSTPKVSKPSLSSKLAKGFNTASYIYGIGELTGINDWALDKVGAKYGTKSRAVIDKGRNVLDWGLFAKGVDDILLKGTGRKAITSTVKSVAPAIGSELASTGTAVAGALGTGGMIAGGAAILGGGLVVADYKIKADKGEARQQEILNILKSGKTPFMDNKGNVTALPSHKDFVAKAETNKYKYNNGQTSAIFKSPSSYWGTDFKTDMWKTSIIGAATSGYQKYKADIQGSMNQWQSKVTEASRQFTEAQKIYSNNNGGKKLTYNDYSHDMQLQAEAKKVVADINTKIKTAGGFLDNPAFTGKLDSINSNVQSLNKQAPPIVNVAAPKVNVTVHVDKQGNSTTTQSVINDYSSLDTAYKLAHSRMADRR